MCISYHNVVQESDVKYVPCSGLAGENLIKGSDVKEFTQWYSGPTLLEVIGKSIFIVLRLF